MKNLLIIAQKVDEHDDLLGFFVDWIREFAKHFDNVSVITLLSGKFDLPGNVQIYSLGKEDNAPKLLQAARFYKFLFLLVPKSNGIFAHMSPVFAIAAWPAAFIFRRKIVLWYLHRSVTFKLRLAEKLCFKIVTAAKESLRIKSDKIVETGHGINIDRFKTERNWNDLGLRRLNVLSIGRISKIKNYETIVKAAGILKNKNINFKLTIVGRPVMPGDFSYQRELEDLVKELGLKDVVDFKGFIPYNQTPDYYKECDIFVNLTPTGGIDKAVLEAMAAGCLVFVSNEAFKKYFGPYAPQLIFEYGDDKDLFEKINNIRNLPVDRINEIKSFLVNSVRSNHDIKTTIQKISSLYK